MLRSTPAGISLASSQLAQTAERGLFDMLFLADTSGVPSDDMENARHTRLRGVDRTLHDDGRAVVRYPSHWSGVHVVDEFRATIRSRSQVRFARSRQRRSRRLEPDHIGEPARMAQLRRRAAGQPPPALARAREFAKRGPRSVGQLGRRRLRRSISNRGFSSIPTSSTSWTTRASISRSAARSMSRVRHKASRCWCRPAPPRTAGTSPPKPLT